MSDRLVKSTKDSVWQLFIVGGVGGEWWEIDVSQVSEYASHGYPVRLANRDYSDAGPTRLELVKMGFNMERYSNKKRGAKC